MAKRILVSIADEQSEVMVPLIRHLGRAGGATVRLLFVRPIPHSHVGAYGQPVERQALMARLEAESLEYLRGVEVDLDGIPVERVVRFGDAAQETLIEAEAFGADLIAASTTTRSWLAGALIGDPAHRVFRRAQTPVLLLGAA